MRQLVERDIISGIEAGTILPQHIADVLSRCSRAASRIVMPTSGHPDLESLERERESIERINADALTAQNNVALLERIVADRLITLPESLSDALARQSRDQNRYA